MQVTQDKDLNEVFQRKFDSFEVEPSSAVWSGIASKLEEHKKRRSLQASWLWAAASVLIIIGAGFWLFFPRERIYLQGKTEDSIVKNEDILPVEEAPVNKVISNNKKAITPDKLSFSADNIITVTGGKEIGDPAAIQTGGRQVNENETAVKETIIIDQGNDLSTKEENKPKLNTDQPVFALVNEETSAYDAEKEKTPQRRVKRVGDLVNFVVGKIDPRSDKLIQFSDDGDGGSEISEINLGLLKFKNRNK